MREPAGKYELGILIKNERGNKEGMVMINKSVNIKK
jgi:hypothetical protein